MPESKFVPFEMALDLKRLGFNNPCTHLYNSTDDKPKPYPSDSGLSQDWNSLYVYKENEHLLSAPTFSQVFAWLETEYNFKVEIGSIFHKDIITYYYNIAYNRVEDNLDTTWHYIDSWEPDVSVLTYQEAEFGCLGKIIEIIDEQTKLYSLDYYLAHPTGEKPTRVTVTNRGFSFAHTLQKVKKLYK